MASSGKTITGLIKKHPVGVGCGLLSLLLLVVINLRSGLFTEGEARLAEVTATGNRLKANINYSSQLSEQLATLTEAVDQLSKRTVRPGELAQNLQYFYKLEAESGARLIDLRQMNPVSPATAKNAPAPTFVSLPFNVGVQGDFENVMAFLRKLENGHHFSRVTQASLRPSGTSNQLTLNLSVQLLGEP